MDREQMKAKARSYCDSIEHEGSIGNVWEAMADFAIEQMQAMQAENKALKREVAAINRGAKTNALVNESLVKQVVDLTSQVRELREALEHYAKPETHRFVNMFGELVFEYPENAEEAQAVLNKHKREAK